MEPTTDSVFIDVSIRKFELFLSRIRECVGRLNNEQIWMRHGEHENAVGNAARITRVRRAKPVSLNSNSISLYSKINAMTQAMLLITNEART